MLYPINNTFLSLMRLVCSSIYVFPISIVHHNCCLIPFSYLNSEVNHLIPQKISVFDKLVRSIIRNCNYFTEREQHYPSMVALTSQIKSIIVTTEGKERHRSYSPPRPKKDCGWKKSQVNFGIFVCSVCG